MVMKEMIEMREMKEMKEMREMKEMKEMIEMIEMIEMKEGTMKEAEEEVITIDETIIIKKKINRNQSDIQSKEHKSQEMTNILNKNPNNLEMKDSQFLLMEICL